MHTGFDFHYRSLRVWLSKFQQRIHIVFIALLFVLTPSWQYLIRRPVSKVRNWRWTSGLCVWNQCCSLLWLLCHEAWIGPWKRWIGCLGSGVTLESMGSTEALLENLRLELKQQKKLQWKPEERHNAKAHITALSSKVQNYKSSNLSFQRCSPTFQLLSLSASLDHLLFLTWLLFYLSFLDSLPK